MRRGVVMMVALVVLGLTGCAGDEPADPPAADATSVAGSESPESTTVEQSTTEAESAEDFVRRLEQTRGHPENPDTPTWAQAVDLFRDAAFALTVESCQPGSHCEEINLDQIARYAEFIYLPLGDLEAPPELADQVERTRAAAEAVNAESTRETVAELAAALDEWDTYR